MRRAVTIMLGTAVLAGLLLATPAPRARAEDSAAIQRLLDSAAYWEERGRTDKLLEIYAKILRADPDHVETLAALARHHAAAGNAAEAAEYLRRLEEVDPDHPAVSSVERSVTATPGDDRALTEARRLVALDRVADAIPHYREYFGDGTPSGPVAIEFYQTLGGVSDEGWEEARAGLERIVQHNPGSVRARLALAKHHTYRESTRRDGIREIEEIAADDAVSGEAEQAWRDALMWLNAGPDDVALFRTYLTEVGEDEDLRARMDALGSVAAARSQQLDRLDLGFTALQDGDLERAEAVFDRALTRNGNNLDAVVGLATVEMEKEDFARARDLFERAKELAPGRPEKWRQPLRSASFWEELHEAERLTRLGEFERARTLLEAARGREVDEVVHADVALGNLLMEMERFGEAEQVFATVTEEHPDSTAALSAMVHLKLREGRHDEADALNQRLAALDAGEALSPERIQSEMIRHRAEFEREIGDLRRARGLLAEAHRLDPESEWLLFELAAVHVELGEVGEAREELDELVEMRPDEPEFRLASARLYAEQGLLAQALREMRAVPEDRMGDEARSFKTLLETRATARLAVERGTVRGQPKVARDTLRRLEREARSTPEALAEVALAWSDLGDHERGLSLIRSAAAQSLYEDLGVQLQLGAILLRAGEYEELAQLIAEVREDPYLTPRQERDVDDLRIATAVRRADDAAARGEHDAALGHLAPMLREFPDEERLINAVGRQLIAEGNYAEAETVFLEVLELSPDDVEARQGAIVASLKMGRKKQARTMLAEGLERSPDDPRMHLAAGRARAMMGNDGKAVQHLRRALALQSEALPEPPEGAEQDDGRLAMRDDSEQAGRVYEQILRGAMEGTAGQTAAEEPDLDATLYGQVLVEIDRIHERHRAEISGGLHVRNRGGEGGMSQLVELGVPVQVRLPTGYRGHFEIAATPLYVYAGALDASEVAVAERFGTYGTASLVTDEDSVYQQFGVELQGGYAIRGYRFWVGSTPLGFERMTVTGGIVLADRIDHFGFRLEGFREAKRDSLLTYAGLEDPLTGEEWGGVTRNGGRLDLSVDRRPMLVYVFGGYEFLLGRHVPMNRRWQGGAGLKWTPVETGKLSLTTGVSGMGMGYVENLRFFTFGHAGYFSPQLFFNGGVPLEFRGDTGPFEFAVEVHLGLNWFREESMPYYPVDEDLQGAREEVLDAEGQPVSPVYEGRDTLSFALTAGLLLDYEITDHVTAGLDVRLHTAAEYTELVGGLNVGYSFGSPSPGNRAARGRK